MIDVELRVIDNGLIDAYAEIAEHSLEFVNRNVETVVRETSPDLLDDFRREPIEGPQGSIEWTSEKQHRYVMSRKRRGLITGRQHRVSKGWRVAVLYEPDGISGIRLWNVEESTIFVEGLFQQKWLEAIGWLNAPDLVTKWQQILTDNVETALIKSWYEVS